MSTTIPWRLAGVELYFERLPEARQFYTGVLGFQVMDEEDGRYARLDSGTCFLCLERKGSESYPSADKAVLFFEVPDLQDAIASAGNDRVVRSGPNWAVLHDPEGHNVMLLQAG